MNRNSCYLQVEENSLSVVALVFPTQPRVASLAQIQRQGNALIKIN